MSSTLGTSHSNSPAAAGSIDWGNVRDQFPVTQRWSWFNSATYGPLPACNIEAQTSFLRETSTGATVPGVGHWWEGADVVRQKIGQLVNASPQDICFLKSTSEGLGLAVTGLDWSPGDEVITYDQEFFSVVYPWLGLGDKGVNVRFVRDRGRFRFDVDDVAELIGPRTRLICLSLVNFSTGFRAPLEAISRLCRQHGIWLVVDAVQAVGCLSVDVQSLGADLVAAHGYKALCAGYGIAFCYVAPRFRQALNVPVPGWKSVEDVLDLTDLTYHPDYDLVLAHDARRFESGVQNLAGIYGMGASVDLFLGLGVDAINDHVLSISALVTKTVESCGYHVVSSSAAGERSGIVSFECPGDDPERVVAALQESGVVCAAREGRIRVSSHLFVGEKDVERLGAMLVRARRG